MRRSTIVFLLLLLVMAGLYYYFNRRDQSADIALTAEPESQSSYLFTAEDGVPTDIRIEAKTGEKVEITRDAEDAWALTSPIEAEAEQGSAEAAATQVTTLRILDRVPDVDPEIVGLKPPEYTLTIQFTGGVERKAEIGVVTPTESGYYVRSVEGEILIVSKSSLDALLGLLTNPPYLETPTPSPVPATETPAPPASEVGTAAAKSPAP